MSLLLGSEVSIPGGMQVEDEQSFLQHPRETEAVGQGDPTSPPNEGSLTGSLCSFFQRYVCEADEDKQRYIRS